MVGGKDWIKLEWTKLRLCLDWRERNRGIELGLVWFNGDAV